jgi:hypothetical protein
MSNGGEDWRKLFGAIDVSISGVQNAPATPPTPANSNSTPPVSTTSSTPGLLQRATTFGTSMAKFAAGGFQTSTGDLQQSRLAVCQSCPQLQNNMCLACGCIIPLKVKMPLEHCPLGRWPA